MAFEALFAREAESDFGQIRLFYRRQILDAIEAHLSYTPTEVRRSRVKRLRLLESPAYRLRVGDFRVYYDVDEMEQVVTVLRILSKEQSLVYLGEVDG